LSAGGRRMGGGFLGFHLPPKLQFDDSWSTLENCGYVRFKRPKRGSRFKDNALSALEYFTNQAVYFGNYFLLYYITIYA